MGSDVTTAPLTPPTLAEAYGFCTALARRHYENFPVASWLLPRRMREPVAVVYAFARLADDMADEGTLAPDMRLAALDDWARQLDLALTGHASHPVFVALTDVMARHALPASLFHDLISAFRQDVTVKCYADFAAVMDYCRRSADPVGRILLHLHGSATEENLRRSDRICSALQLINFWQDLAQDYDENRRIYLPQDDMARFGVTEDHLAERRNDPALRALMAFQYRRARDMMMEGASLGRTVGGRFGWELRLIVAGGLRVLDLLEKAPDPFARPRLRARDGVRMLFTAAQLR